MFTLSYLKLQLLFWFSIQTSQYISWDFFFEWFQTLPCVNLLSKCSMICLQIKYLKLGSRVSWQCFFYSWSWSIFVSKVFTAHYRVTWEKRRVKSFWKVVCVGCRTYVYCSMWLKRNNSHTMSGKQKNIAKYGNGNFHDTSRLDLSWCISK